MHTECIDLKIGGIEFSQCIVDFEYDSADSGSSVQPPYAEELRIIRVQFQVSEDQGFDRFFWVDMQEPFNYMGVEQQVLDWIHAKQEQSKLDKQIEDKGL